MESPVVQFMIDMERIGGEIDDLAPPVPSGTGREAWIGARAEQAVAHIVGTRRHRVDAIIVRGAPEDVPADLADSWPPNLPPVTVNTRPDRYSDPVPSGVYRMWLEISYDPEYQHPDAADGVGWIADMAYVHGISPDPEQEERLRSLAGIGAVWAATRPETLDEALDAVGKARRA